MYNCAPKSYNRASGLPECSLCGSFGDADDAAEADPGGGGVRGVTLPKDFLGDSEIWTKGVADRL